ncbi:MAG: hypothetical protein KH897_06115 [Bacteroides sp.]|uniref:hypothetical protein n=1 Tax=Bacteroides sp. TaxID=29523 RepID=UPI0025C18B00|nr:hypothetical protein [Bacteroides sp.]MBS6237954.1 hypothetical protein [Bacteroides sp.]
MKTGNVCFLLLMCISLLFTGCGNSQSKKSEDNKVGDDKDVHGCIASAGYTWSEVLKDCIRLWEKGVRVEDVADKEKAAYIVFSPDSLQVELFFSDDRPNEILDRRSLPAGGYAWNVEDDDTKNVRLENDKWTISQRGKLIYQQVEEAQ